MVILNNITNRLIEIAQSHYAIHDERCIVRGLWKNQYILQLTKKESIFNLKYLIVQTKHQGCCYLEDYVNGVDESIIGENLLYSPLISKEKTITIGITIAYLDAVFASIISEPDERLEINGNNYEKASQRNKIVCDEVKNVLKSRTPKNGNKHNVLVVGVVGGFLYELTKGRNLNVSACDFYSKIVGKDIHGVKVEHGTKKDSSKLGDRTLELLVDADIALVTGMTLANNTLEEILSVAKKNNTAVVVFAETGANFAEEYCKMGVDSVISEPHPFYLVCAGSTEIKIYRKKEK